MDRDLAQELGVSATSVENSIAYALGGFPLPRFQEEGREIPLRIEFDRRCREAGIGDRLNVVAEVGPWTTILEYVKDGLGIGLLPRSALPENHGLAVRPLPGKLAPLTKWQAICRKKAGTDEFDLSPAGPAVLTSMRTAAKTMRTD